MSEKLLSVSLYADAYLAVLRQEVRAMDNDLDDFLGDKMSVEH